MRDDAARGEVALFSDRVRVGIPARGLQSGHDKLSACIRLVGHGLIAKTIANRSLVLDVS